MAQRKRDNRRRKLTGQYEGANSGDEPSEKGIEGESANEKTKDELIDPSEEDEEEEGVDQL
jgi:hypothetical protein